MMLCSGWGETGSSGGSAKNLGTAAFCCLVVSSFITRLTIFRLAGAVAATRSAQAASCSTLMTSLARGPHQWEDPPQPYSNTLQPGLTIRANWRNAGYVIQ